MVNDNGNRGHQKLFELGLKEVFNILSSTLYGEGNPQYNELAEEEMWARFDISMNIDIFYNYKVFLVESEEDLARIIFNDRDGLLHQSYIKKGIVDDVFQKFYTDFNKIYDELIINQQNNKTN